MKRFLATAVVLVASAVAALAADPIEGVWQTEPDDGAFALVTVAPCGAKICGVISRTFRTDGEYKSENIGKNLVFDMVPVGGGRYQGQVWRPSNGKTYIGKMELQGDQLKLRGCVAGGLLCSAQNWIRVQ